MTQTAGLLIIAGMYVVGARVLRHRAGRRGLAWPRILAALGGLIALWAAVESPLAEMAERRLSWHMIQHAVIMVAAPWLLIYGRVGTGILWSLPARTRVGWTRHPRIRMALRLRAAVESPIPAALFYAAALWIWHVPALYDRALAHEGLHIAEHATFFVAALAFWSSIARERAATTFGLSAVALFLTAIQSGALGALLTMSSTIWYRSYVGAPATEASALADQRWAGLLMWIPLGLPYIATGLASAAMMLDTARRRAGTSTTDALRASSGATIDAHDKT